MKKTLTNLVVGLTIVGLLVGCGLSKRDQGILIGAGAGAAAGAAIGDQAGNTALGAILGAVVGGAAGAYIGNYMDKQAEEMKRDLEGATIERVGEGIKITFDSGILFDINKSGLRGEAVMNLDKLAVILNKYPDTEVLIEGHTDNTGEAEHNRQLSMSRAQSVATTLSGKQVNPTRFTIMGYGWDQPVANNATAQGRQANRRVDIAVFANDKLKGVAEDQVGG